MFVVIATIMGIKLKHAQKDVANVSTPPAACIYRRKKANGQETVTKKLNLLLTDVLTYGWHTFYLPNFTSSVNWNILFLIHFWTLFSVQTLFICQIDIHKTVDIIELWLRKHCEILKDLISYIAEIMFLLLDKYWQEIGN